MKISVPPAPVSELGTSTLDQKPRRSRASGGLIAAFDDGFVGRVIVSMLGVGALLMLGVLGATNSPLAAISFFCGVGLGALLLKSQELFVKRVLAPRIEGEKSLWARAPLAALLTFKYIVLVVVLGIAVERNWLSPPALALGFIVGQIVIVGKVVGRFAALKNKAKERED